MDSISISSNTNGVKIDGFSGVSMNYNRDNQVSFGSSLLTIRPYSYTIAHPSALDGDDLTISSTDSSLLILSSEGTGGDAISLNTSNGGITLDGMSGVSLNIDNINQAYFGSGNLTLLENSPYTITHPSTGIGENLTISENSNNLIFSSTGTCNGSVIMNSNSGGVSIFGANTQNGGVTFNKYTTMYGISSTTNSTSQSSLWSITYTLGESFCYHAKATLLAMDSSSTSCASYVLKGEINYDGVDTSYLITTPTVLSMGSTGSICDPANITFQINNKNLNIVATPIVTNNINWQGGITLTKSAGREYLYGVCGSGLIVSGGPNEALAYSDDGALTWIYATTPSTGTTNSIAYGTSDGVSPLWVSCGLYDNGDASFWSSDGINWNSSGLSYFDTSPNATTVAYGVCSGVCLNPLWVIGGKDSSNANLMCSGNGKDWVLVSTAPGITEGVCGIAFGTSDGTSPLWVASGGGEDSIAWSADGKNWNSGSGTMPLTGSKVAYGTSDSTNPLWVLTGQTDGTDSYYSSNGKNWSQATTGNQLSNLTDTITYGRSTYKENPMWQRTSGSNYTDYSIDGKNFTSSSTFSTGSIKGITYCLSGGDTLWVANGSDAHYSDDGINFTAGTGDMFTGIGKTVCYEAPLGPISLNIQRLPNTFYPITYVPPGAGTPPEITFAYTTFLGSNYSLLIIGTLTKDHVDEGIANIGHAITGVSIGSSVTSIGIIGDTISTAPFYNSGITTITFNDITNSGCSLIGDNAFYGCSLFTEIILPTSLRKIGTRSFESCAGLSTLTIPEGVLTVGNNAYQDCTNLTGVSFPSTLIQLGTNVFKTSGLTSVILPDSLQTVPAGAFNSCYSLSTIDFGSGVSSIGINSFVGCGFSGVSIPENVLSIGANAFNNITFNYVTFEASGVSRNINIDTTSFNNPTSLISAGLSNTFHLPISTITFTDAETAYRNSITGDYILGTDANITLAVVSSAVTSIGGDITYVGVGSTGISIGASAFMNTSLTGLNLGSATNLISIGACAFYNLPNLTGTLTIPATVSELGYQSFDNTSLTKVTFKSSGVSLTIPTPSSNLILASWYTPRSTGSIPETSGVPGAISYFPYIDYTSLTSQASAVGMPSDNYNIRFDGYINFPYSGSWTMYTKSDDGTRLYMDGSATATVNSWTDQAPKEKSGPYTATTSGLHRFRLEYYENGGGEFVQMSWESPSNGFSKAVIAQSYYHSIFNFPFKSGNVSALTPNITVGGIANLADLSSATISNLNNAKFYQDIVFSVADSYTTFLGSNYSILIIGTLTRSHVDEAITNIGHAITGVNIGTSVTSIGDVGDDNTTAPFYNSSISSITFKDVTHSGCSLIGDNAFYGCSLIDYIAIPGEVYNIGNSAFQNCSSLAGVSFYHINSTVYEFRYFKWYITDLKNYSSANSIQCDEFIFATDDVDDPMTGVTGTNPGGNNPGTETPPNLIDSNSSTKWLDLNMKTTHDSTYIFDFGSGQTRSFTRYKLRTANDNIDRDPKTWTILGSNDQVVWTLLDTVSDGALTDSRTTLTSYYAIDNISGGNLTLGTSVFQSSGVSSIILPDSLLSLSENAFNSCVGLSTITFGGGVSSLGNSSFEGCTNLIDLIIPDTIVGIGASAFKNAINLNSVTIGTGITSIGVDAFKNDTGIATLTWNAGNARAVSVGVCAFETPDTFLGYVNNTYNVPIEGEIFIDNVVPDS